MGGQLTLPEEDDDSEGRLELLRAARRTYQFDLDPPYLPKHLRRGPLLEAATRTTRERTKRIDPPIPWTRLTEDTFLSVVKQHQFSLMGDFKMRGKPLRDYELVFPSDSAGAGCCADLPLSCPKVAAEWRSDSEFGRQQLNGYDPLSIKRFREYVAKFPVEREENVLKQLSSGGRFFETEMQNNRLYWVDLAELDGVQALAPGGGIASVSPLAAPPSARRGKQGGAPTLLCAPMALFWLNAEDQLLPLAIQLQQHPLGLSNPIFTPLDPPGLWLLVKTHFRHASSIYHEHVQHCFSSRMVAEVFYVAARRTLSERHPVMRILHIHCAELTRKNAELREAIRKQEEDPQPPNDEEQDEDKAPPMISRLIPALICKANMSFDLDTLDVEKDIAARDITRVPNFFYRDDALRLFLVIKGFMRRTVETIYPEESALLRDKEIRAWLPECTASVGWKHMPSCVTSRSMLVDLLAVLVNTSTARLAAVTLPLFPLRGFVPNSPCRIGVPPPTSRGIDITEQEIADALPDYQQTISQVVFYFRSAPTSADRTLHQLYLSSSVWSGMKGAKDNVQQFVRELKELSCCIENRNKTLTHPYTFLDPKVVPA
jgi:hypothetical protein